MYREMIFKMITNPHVCSFGDPGSLINTEAQEQVRPEWSRLGVQMVKEAGVFRA